MSAPTFTYVPAPHERAYYGALFQAADTERTGSIGGGRAVEFFTRSKVPIAVLKQIWTASDQPPSNSLDPRKFAVAVRLIQLEQNGVKPSAGDLAQAGGPNLRPAFFEGIPPPPSSPQQGGVPLPPQGPPPQQQQHEVPTPPRPPNASISSMGGSVASASVGGPPPPQQQPHMPLQQQQQQQQLAVQDPYTLTPQEQARYEQIFPEYCKQDPNFMYGAEAVALFGKSGLDQAKLAQIWNMVDHPVDNRLDKLEFAMAMHLIVCVSKKNLPLPPALPLSLKQLKSQKPPGMPPQQQQQNGGPDGSMGGGGGGSMGGGGAGGGSFSMAPPSPRGMMQQAPPSPQQQQQPQMADASPGGIPSPGRGPPPLPSGFGAGGGRGPSSSGMMGAGASSSLSGLPGPPPISQQAGGLSISDAFEGLAAGNGDTGSISSYRATTPVVTQNTPSYVHSNHDDEPSKPPEPVSEASEPAPVPKTSIQLASSYEMGDTHEELVKLRAILQKLQAENISLKARMEGMTEEEKDIQRELSATVSEVSKLSSELTTLRAQVLASKSRLLEASAELKAAKEKKGVISDLISEARATKTAIDEAYEGVETANEAAHAAPPAPAPAETDFFGGWGSDAPPPAPLPAPTENAPLRARTENVESSSQPQHDETPSYDHTPAPAAPGMFDGGGYDPGHNRNISNMSGFGEVMGTGPGLGSLSAVDETSMYGSGSIPGSPSMAEVEIMKSKSKEADDVAKDAEESRRQLTAQLEEMRRLADEAENLSRAASAKPVKKKGLLRRGGVQEKKDAKELERLAMDARDKKEKLMHVQAQVKDAEALASATKKEAEKLNKEAEDAQMQAASMASMQQQPHPNPTPPPPSMQEQKQPPPPQVGLNGYPPQSSGMPMSYGMGQAPSNSNNNEGGFGGFDANVMGSGGSSIPTPANGGGDDPYSNPFE